MDTSDDATDLDGDVLGEDIGDDGLPGIGDYPPDQARGVNDPNLVADDDVAMREARTRGEEVAAEPEPVADLIAPDDGEVLDDREHQAIADRSDDDGDRATPPAEVAAVHVDPET